MRALSDSALLDVERLTVRYGGLAAVDGVSLRVDEGSIAGLIGPNGAGKTTMIDALSGLAPCSGTVTFGGESIGRCSPHVRARKGLRRTFQNLELFEELTIRENLLVTAESARWWSMVRDLFWPRTQGAAVEAVEHALELVELADHAGAYPNDLSLGQRKLVTVAAGVAARPRLLLLDEPAAGLDTAESGELADTLRRIASEGTTILLVDHDMELVLGACEQIYVLQFGRLIADGKPDEIATDERVITAYLGGEDLLDDVRPVEGSSS